jgi:hypothetical protein
VPVGRWHAKCTKLPVIPLDLGRHHPDTLIPQWRHGNPLPASFWKWVVVPAAGTHGKSNPHARFSGLLALKPL